MQVVGATWNYASIRRGVLVSIQMVFDGTWGGSSLLHRKCGRGHLFKPMVDQALQDRTRFELSLSLRDQGCTWRQWILVAKRTKKLRASLDFTENYTVGLDKRWFSGIAPSKLFLLALASAPEIEYCVPNLSALRGRGGGRWLTGEVKEKRAGERGAVWGMGEGVVEGRRGGHGGRGRELEGRSGNGRQGTEAGGVEGGRGGRGNERGGKVRGSGNT